MINHINLLITKVIYNKVYDDKLVVINFVIINFYMINLLTEKTLAHIILLIQKLCIGACTVRSTRQAGTPHSTGLASSRRGLKKKLGRSPAAKYFTMICISTPNY